MAQDTFTARLERLNDTPHRQYIQRRQMAAQSARGPYPEWVRNLAYPSSILLACIVGLLTVVMSRYIMFHLNGVPGADADADLTMIMDGALAAGIAFVIRSALNMKAKEHLAFKAAGIWIALTGMHNLVHAYPAIWENTFSPEWVQYTTERTEPKSFYFSGMSFHIGGEQGDSESPEKKHTEIKINRF